MEVQVTIDIPDEIMQESLVALAQKHSIDISSLEPQQAINEVAQAVADDVLRFIGNELVKAKAQEEKQRLSSILPQKTVVWQPPTIVDAYQPEE